MKILITGATGLIGRSLLKKLDGDITVMSRNIEESSKLQKRFPKIKILDGDIADEQLVRIALRKNFDIIYHLAALRAVGIAEKEVEHCIDTNIIGTLNLLKYFKGKKFVTLSSDKAVQISSVYGASKFLVEKLVTEYSKINLNISYSVIRSGNVFGSTNSVMSVWKRQLRLGREVIVTDLDATRYFCTVEEVVDKILEDYSFYRSTIRPMYLKSVSLKVLLKAMQKKYGKAKKINKIGIQVGENKHEKMNGISSEIAIKYTIKELLELI